MKLCHERSASKKGEGGNSTSGKICSRIEIYSRLIRMKIVSNWIQLVDLAEITDLLCTLDGLAYVCTYREPAGIQRIWHNDDLPPRKFSLKANARRSKPNRLVELI